MAKGFTGELLHFGAVRYRVTGIGNFHTELQSLDEVISVDLADIPLLVTTNREPTILANLVEQRAMVYGNVNQIGDQFNISKITVFIVAQATGYPQ